MSDRPQAGWVLGSGAYGDFEGAADDAVVFGAYRRDGVWSPALVELLGRLLGGSDGTGTLIDVGAHIGLVAVAALERTAGARCVAFEPAPLNYELLCRNVRRHGLTARVATHRIALSDRTGQEELALCADNSGDHHLVLANDPADSRCTSGARTESSPRPRVTVATARLCDVLVADTLTAPVVMKLDCQGAEARVLRGARPLLARVDHLVVEWWPQGLLRMGDDTRALHALLAELPYATLIDQHAGPGPLQDSRTFLDSLSWIPSDGSDPGFFDLLLSRSPQLSAGACETRASR